uniref:Metalloendopeptidase n=1 Tax=Meloidogyne enterolobii TaxID=390850 RepID=A0A6V7WKJ9_MELEN|nr:unnamed protein product [Meloidogyne enterolobii]
MEGIKIEKEIPRDIGKDIKSKQSFNNKKLNEQQQDTIQFYDLNVPSYETVLTPTDFELAMELDDSPNESDWDSEAMYNLDKFEGDIANKINASTVALFIRGAPEKADSKTNKGRIQLNAIRDRRQLWNNARIPYALSSQYSSYSRSVIASAMQEYAKHTCIQWTPRTAMDRDYVYIVPERGCYSMVGRTTDRQILSLGNGCIQKGIIIHEMMHAVGFFHEQSRPDRDDFIAILWHNILPGMQGQFEKYSQATIQTLGSDYDYGSIMHYGPNAFTRNGLPTIMPRRQAAIGQRVGFSKLDAWKINTLYDCPNYGGSYGGGNSQSSTTSPVFPQPQPVASTLRPFVPTTPRLCRNTRPDCDLLASQGWCSRNPQWMREHCPVSCRMCLIPNVETRRPSPPHSLPFPSPRPIVPLTSTIPTTTSTSPPMPVCEDLRVDCAELAKRRYCITAPSFTRTFCARSCGFCFVPLATDSPSSSLGGNSLIISSSQSPPTTFTQRPMVTFWPYRPSSSNETKPPLSSSLYSKGKPPMGSCKDRKHFCSIWKHSGFCQGVFQGYMKKNCPATCGFC